MIHCQNVKIKKCNYKKTKFKALEIYLYYYSFLLYSRGPKKLLTGTELVTKRPKGKKCHVKEENNQAAEINVLPTQSRRETRNSVKAAAAFQKQKENSDEIIKNSKRQLMYVSLISYYTNFLHITEKFVFNV